MVEKRELWLCIVLSLVTCGLYYYYWLYKMNEDVNILVADENPTDGIMLIVLSIVTCGIYYLYWAYKTGAKLDDACVANGLPAQSRAVIYLVCGLFCGIAGYALMQDTINKLADVQA